MTFRRFVYDLMIAGPILLLGLLAIQGRFAVPEFQPVGYTQKQNAELLAYRDIILAMEHHNIARNLRPKPEDVRKVALQWKQGIESGKLAPFQPQYASDTCNEGIKGQVRTACQRILLELSNLAENPKSGTPKQRADDLETGLFITKHYIRDDLSAIGFFGTCQRQLFEVAVKASKDFPKEERLRLAKLIESTNFDSSRLEAALSRAGKLYVLDGVRQGEERIWIVDRVMEREHLGNATVSNALLASSDSDGSLPAITTIAAFARSAFRNGAEARVRTLRALQLSEPTKAQPNSVAH